MAKSGEIALAVGRSLRGAKIPPSDAAAVALAKRYARLIDEAAALAEAAGAIWEDLAIGDEDGRKRLQALERQLDAQAVVSDLGPKLLQALSALGLTLAGRPASKGVSANGRPTPAATALAAQRAAAEAARQHRTAPVD